MDHGCIICYPDTKETPLICDRCTNLQSATKRAELFKSILNTFGIKARTDFNLLEATCKNLVNSILKIKFDFTPTNTFSENNHTRFVDPVAQAYMKGQKRFDDFVPIMCESDGNCLYHSIKQLMPNMTATVTELRVRAMIEIVNNHMAYVKQYPDVVEVCDEFRQYCRQVNDKEHAQIWDIFGLCEVLKYRIQLMCAKDPPLHRLQNTTYSPINNLQNVTNDITLMWTNELSEKELLRCNKNFTTNHFVLLLRRGNIKPKPGNIFTCFTIMFASVNQQGIVENRYCRI
jgi:hypothetical protein